MTRDELTTARLVRYLHGEMTRSELEDTARRIADSRSAQAELASLRALEDRLREPPAWVAGEGDGLVEAVRARLAAPAAAPRPLRSPRRRWAWAGVAAAAVAAAGLALVVGRGGSPTIGDAGFRAKGGAASEGRWVGVKLVRLVDGRAAPVEGAPAGELAVAYTNLGPDPYPYLMVFAIDAAGAVRWFYPAYERAGTDPAAVPIAAGVAERVLPDLVEHAFAPGAVRLCGLFLRAPATVSAVEAAIGEGREPAAAFPGAAASCTELGAAR